MQYRLVIIIVTFGVTIYSTVANVMGMNLAVTASWKLSYPVFMQTVWLPLIGCFAAVAGILWWARQKKLLLQ